MWKYLVFSFRQWVVGCGQNLHCKKNDHSEHLKILNTCEDSRTWCDLSDHWTRLRLNWAQSGRNNCRRRDWCHRSHPLTRCYGNHFGGRSSRHGPLLCVDHLGSGCTCRLDKSAKPAHRSVWRRVKEPPPSDGCWWRTYRQSAWYDWGRQAFVSLERTLRNSSDCVDNHIPTNSGWKTQRQKKITTGNKPATPAMCVHLPVWMVVPTVAFLIAPVCKRWTIECNGVLFF